MTGTARSRMSRLDRSVLLLSLSLWACGSETQDLTCLEGTACAQLGASSGAGLNAHADGGPASPQSDIPCAVQTVLADRCQLCHDDPTGFGAPIPLTQTRHFSALSPSEPARTLAATALERIHDGESSARMPPPLQPPLDAAQREVLSNWLADGAPPGASCSDEALKPDAGLGSKPTDEKLVCYPLVAHAQGSLDTPYGVGLALDSYVNFTFKTPWRGKVFVRQLNAIIDNARVLHHWVLYKNLTDASGNSVTPTFGAHPEGEVVAVWAPGSSNLNFDEWGDVAYALPDNVSYTLEIHYNSNDAAAVDASGLELCVTTVPPETLASVSWLGTEAILGPSASGTCAPSATEPIRLMAWMPHMHAHGTHMKVEINRQDGSVEVLHDADFDYGYQITYYGDTWVMPGDTITTTCTYDTLVTFGYRTGDEMCYLVTTASPAGALTDLGPVGIAAHGRNACLGL